MKHIMLLSLSFSQCITTSSITFSTNGGRLGDNILNYCKHQWLAYKYNLQLLVPYFEYKEFLPLDQLSQSAHNINKFSFTEIKPIKNDSQINNRCSKCLYIGDFYLLINGLHNRNLWTDQIFQFTIQHPAYGNLLKTMLTPDCNYTPPHKGLTTVAIHIRKGGGFDRPLSSEQYEGDGTGINCDQSQCADRYHPLKFPPEQYYVEQLQMLYKSLDEKLYVYVFTDDTNPQKILERMKKHFDNANIIFDYRRENNSHNQNILLDVYMMSKFDYLIRSASHFPWISQIIGNHKGIIYPKEYIWKKNFLKIHRAVFIKPDRKNKKIIQTILSYK